MNTVIVLILCLASLFTGFVLGAYFTWDHFQKH